MWLKLDLSGIKLSMQIRNYRKVSDDDWDSVWCKTDFGARLTLHLSLMSG